MMKDAQIWIVSGPSSVGKSRFIRSDDFLLTTQSAENLPTKLILPDEFTPEALDSGHINAVHYNILRPVQSLISSRGFNASHSVAQRSAFVGKWLAAAIQGRLGFPTNRATFPDFKNDLAWERIAECSVGKKAIVLGTHRAELHRRVEQRKIVEVDHPKGRVPYDSGYWKRVYESIDISELYLAWCDELERCGIDYFLLDSTTPSYRQIDRTRLLEILK